MPFTVVVNSPLAASTEAEEIMRKDDAAEIVHATPVPHSTFSRVIQETFTATKKTCKKLIVEKKGTGRKFYKIIKNQLQLEN